MNTLLFLVQTIVTYGFFIDNQKCQKICINQLLLILKKTTSQLKNLLELNNDNDNLEKILIYSKSIFIFFSNKKALINLNLSYLTNPFLNSNLKITKI